MANPRTQDFVKVDNIRNDVVVVKGGQLRAILQVSSLNLALKSADEQEAIVYEYQNFLNSLDFPIQILVNSRLMNVDKYIEKLSTMVDKQNSPLMQMQTQEYIKFIQRFVEDVNIVSTDFYVVIPFSLIEVSTSEGGARERLKSLFGGGNADKLGTLNPEKFMFYRGQLMQRVDFIASGLHRIGVSVRMLPTEELISLFWSAYNPEDLRKRGLIKPLFE
ncbi:MAG: hypothetical protein R3346_00955 [Candidatus Spechtbacterales bacterium]|nr:hypothetical protein [Candidatus Spechtbacterales bacterium]